MTNTAITNLRSLLQSMQPVRHDGVYVYTSVALESDISPLRFIASFREAEAITLIMPEQQALDAGLAILFRAAWITLTVHSDLQAVGLTAAFAQALADVGISCNVVAAVYHDHLFVPLADAEKAMQTLWQLQKSNHES